MNPNTSSETDHPDSAKAIWVFTPSRTDPKSLEFILVQRQQLLQDAVERVRESVLTDHKHHLLFVGPRGCGKTHLVTLIVSRLTADETLSDRLRLAWLNEDETCTTPLELFLKIHAALEKRYPAEYRAEMLAAAYDLDADAAQDFVGQHLLASLGPRTLVVVTENLDAIFDGLRQEGQMKLRSFIQEHPKLSLVATAQRLVEDLSDRASPFFGFFQTEHLKPLNVEEATELLRNIAKLQEKTEVVEFLATSRGRSRVRALHHLSGGNHRIYIVLSQFITRDSIDALVGPFLKMVDELTPYYQERVRWLPPLQRKIVEYLCSCESTTPVKDIAKKLFSTPQTISSQLQDLREKGYVEANQRGRESLYEISEPLMRICVEVKENQDHQPLRLLVDFLRVWYDNSDLDQRLGAIDPTSSCRAYLEAALKRNKAEGNLRIRLLAEELGIFLHRPVSQNDLENLKTHFSDCLLLGLRCQEDGNVVDSIRCYSEVINQPGTSPEEASVALVNRGLLQGHQGDLAAAIVDYTRVIELPGALPYQVAVALIKRGLTKGHEGDSAAEITDYTRAIELPGIPPDQMAKALVYRGITYRELGDNAAAIADFSRAITLPDAPTEEVAKALGNRGITYDRLGDSTAAIADFTQTIDLPGAPPEQVSLALVSRALARGQHEDSTAAITDLTRAIELPGTPPEQVALAFLDRGLMYGAQGNSAAAVADLTRAINSPGAFPTQLALAFAGLGLTHRLQGDNAAAIAYYTRAIELPEISPEQVAMALISRGETYSRQRDSAAAIADYSQATELLGAPPEQVASALRNRGIEYFMSGRKQEAQTDFETIVQLSNGHGKPALVAFLALAALYWTAGRWKEGFDALEAGLKRGALREPLYRETSPDLIGVLFSAGLNPEGRIAKVSDLLRLYANYEALPVLGEALVQHIGQVFRTGEPFPSTDNLEQWVTAWEQAAASVPDFSLSIRVLRTGVDYVKAGGKDPGILLTLTSAEREILRQALGLPEKNS